MQRVARQLIDGSLPRLGADLVGDAGDPDAVAAGDPEDTGRRGEAETSVAEAVQVLIRGEARRGLIVHVLDAYAVRLHYQRIERWVEL